MRDTERKAWVRTLHIEKRKGEKGRERERERERKRERIRGVRDRIRIKRGNRGAVGMSERENRRGERVLWSELNRRGQRSPHFLC